MTWPDHITCRDTAHHLRASYVHGDIAVDEYERRLDALLARDPDALDRDPYDLYTQRPMSLDRGRMR